MAFFVTYARSIFAHVEQPTSPDNEDDRDPDFGNLIISITDLLRRVIYAGTDGYDHPAEPDTDQLDTAKSRVDEPDQYTIRQRCQCDLGSEFGIEAVSMTTPAGLATTRSGKRD
jgi:hypothetical protein